MPTQVVNAQAVLRAGGAQPYVEVNDGPANSGTFNLTLNDATTGLTLSTLAHLADSFDQAQTKFFLTLPLAQLAGKVLVCTAVLKRVGPGPLVFQLWVKQDGTTAPAPAAQVNSPTENLQTVAMRVALTVAP